jgi:hypothetical protein
LLAIFVFLLFLQFGGLSSSLLGGWLTSRWQSKQPRAPALIPALGALTAIPFLLGCLFADRLVADADWAYVLAMVGASLCYFEFSIVNRFLSILHIILKKKPKPPFVSNFKCLF